MYSYSLLIFFMITIVSALKAEITPLIQKIPVSEKKVLAGGSLYIAGKIHFLRTGVGRYKASEVIKTYLKHYKPQKILNIGLAGKLNTELKIAQICNISEIFYSDNESIKIDIKDESSTAKLLTVDEAVMDASLRDSLFIKYGAHVVDMEAYFLADICKNMNIRFSCIKIISDDADKNTEDFFLREYKRLAEKLALYIWKEFLK